MKTWIRLLRPRQWTKNSLIFAAIIFAQQFQDVSQWIRAILAFIAFSLTASAIYIINDAFDIEADRNHPVKCKRPLAAGEIDVVMAVFIALLIAGIGLGLAWYVHYTVLIYTACYFGMMILYSFQFKHVLVLDVIIIATGLTIRAIVGAEAIQVDVSRWLLVCTFFVALMLALVKRRQELLRIGEERDKGRKSLMKAPPVKVWDLWIMAMSGITILAYTLYTMDPVTVAKVGSENLLYTVPFVVYGILRYHIVVYKSDGGEDPTETLLSDRTIWITVLAWLAAVLFVLNG